MLAGDSDHEDRYGKYIKRLSKKHSSIVLTGFISGEELGEIFSNAGVFILPSSHEGLPIALLEALSYNIPCIASDIPSNKAVNFNEIDYVKKDDIDSLSSAMKQHIEKQHLFQRVNSKVFVEKNYNWKYIAEKINFVYLSLS